MQLIAEENMYQVISPATVCIHIKSLPVALWNLYFAFIKNDLDQSKLHQYGKIIGN
jgi:hypothetical protein